MHNVDIFYMKKNQFNGSFLRRIEQKGKKTIKI